MAGTPASAGHRSAHNQTGARRVKCAHQDRADHDATSAFDAAATVWSPLGPLICRACSSRSKALTGPARPPSSTASQEHLNATVLREPGGVELSERIRALVQDPDLEVHPRAEALLYAAARAQLVAEKLQPLLDANTTVILDRFIDSSLAYQGGGRELGVDAIRALNEFGTHGLTPDLTLLLRIEPEQGLARIAGREQDRLEGAGLAFFQRVADDLRRARRSSPTS